MFPFLRLAPQSLESPAGTTPRGHPIKRGVDGEMGSHQLCDQSIPVLVEMAYASFRASQDRADLVHPQTVGQERSEVQVGKPIAVELVE
ncbi:MAG: hypothetical protein IH974_08925 [Myxococcales bacterium]|nr:hypothetical protein [Myxococcales bacterium]